MKLTMIRLSALLLTLSFFGALACSGGLGGCDKSATPAEGGQ